MSTRKKAPLSSERFHPARPDKLMRCASEPIHSCAYCPAVFAASILWKPGLIRLDLDSAQLHSVTDGRPVDLDRQPFQ
jgi:hypothetical protein